MKEQVFLILTAMVCLVSVTRTVTREPTVMLLLSSSSKTSAKRKATHLLDFFKAFSPLHMASATSKRKHSNSRIFNKK